MFIGHLPGGYLAFKFLAPKLPKAAFAAGLVASVIPDLDLLWFYLVDGKAHLHHHYISHRPIVWVLTALVGAALSRKWDFGVIIAAFGCGGLIHMVLDTIAGSINWLWPFAQWGVPLVVVPSTHDHWVLSFLTHWTFFNELVLVAFALLVFLRVRRARQH